MSAPLSRCYWEALRFLAEPLELVKFTLIFDGDLPSAGNRPQPGSASDIRNVFHDQLADFWDSHVVLRQLARTARTYPHGAYYASEKYPAPGLPKYDEPIPPLNPGQTDYCAPILVVSNSEIGFSNRRQNTRTEGFQRIIYYQIGRYRPLVPKVGNFIPIIRHSLHLACAVDILFLRHEEPLTLMKNGGDLDGRLKTLFDALKMSNPKDRYVGLPPTADPLYVVLEDDDLISDFSVKSGRLLGKAAKKPHAVRLTIDVTVEVLRVFQQNQCLIGG